MPTFAVDERTLASGSRDTSIRMWDVQTGQCTASAKTPRNLVTCLKYLPPESPASLVQGGEDLRLRVWDVRETGLRPSLTIEGYTFFPVIYSADFCVLLFVTGRPYICFFSFSFEGREGGAFT